MSKGLLGIPWWVCGVFSVALAIVWAFVWPAEKVLVHEGFRFFAVRWGHSLVWVLLALSFFLRLAGPRWAGLAEACAVAGGISYLIFLAATYIMN